MSGEALLAVTDAAAEATPTRIGRLHGKMGAGLALLVLSVLVPYLATLLPVELGPLLLEGQTALRALGITLAGWGATDKAKRIAILLRAIATSLEDLPAAPVASPPARPSRGGPSSLASVALLVAALVAAPGCERLCDILAKVQPVVARVVAVLDVAPFGGAAGAKYGAIRHALDLALAPATAACAAKGGDAERVRAAADAMARLLEFYQAHPPPQIRTLKGQTGPTDEEVEDALAELRKVHK